MGSILESVIAWECYDEEERLLGTVKAQLPSLEAVTETISGGGFMGELESSIPGRYKSMKLGLDWHSINISIAKLSQNKLHTLTLRASVDGFNLTKSVYAKQPLRIVVEVKPIKTELGALEEAKKMESKSEFEVHSIQIWLDDQQIVHIDKIRRICVIDGHDELAEVRRHIGLN